MAKILTYYEGLEFTTSFDKSADDTDKLFADKVLLAYKETVKGINKALQKKIEKINKQYTNNEINFEEYCKLASDAVIDGKGVINELSDKCSKIFHEEIAPSTQTDKQK